MKKILYLFSAIVCLFVCVSCWEFEDVDFPDEVDCLKTGLLY